MVKDKVKVLVIHNVVSPHTTLLFKELSKLVDLDVIYCSQDEENRNWKDSPSGFKYKVLPNISIKFRGKDLFTYFINFTILKEFRIIKPEVVIISGWDIFSYQVVFFYCKLRGIKVILWSGSTRYENSWRRTISLPLVRSIVKGSDAYIAYGIRAKEYLEMLGARQDKIFIYKHTTDLDRYRRYPKKYNQKKEKVIMYYGQIIERKGVDILIKAFASIQKRISNIRLSIVGSGFFKNYLIELVSKLGIGKNVNFVEDPGDYKIGKFFSEANLFVLPSREDVWGLVVNEAMASGLPIVVSNNAGCAPDLVQNGVNGYVFKSGSVRDLSNKILRILSSASLMERMGKASSKIIESQTPRNSAEIIYATVKRTLR